MAANSLVRLWIQPEPVATGGYIGVLAKGNAALRDQVNAILSLDDLASTLGALALGEAVDVDAPSLATERRDDGDD